LASVSSLTDPQEGKARGKKGKKIPPNKCNVTFSASKKKERTRREEGGKRRGGRYNFPKVWEESRRNSVSCLRKRKKGGGEAEQVGPEGQVFQHTAFPWKRGKREEEDRRHMYRRRKKNRTKGARSYQGTGKKGTSQGSGKREGGKSSWRWAKKGKKRAKTVRSLYAQKYGENGKTTFVSVSKKKKKQRRGIFLSLPEKGHSRRGGESR